jgi:hypothetical protein
MNEEILGFIQGYVIAAPADCNREMIEREVRTQFPLLNSTTFAEALHEAGRRLQARGERMRRDGQNLHALAELGGW